MSGKNSESSPCRRDSMPLPALLLVALLSACGSDGGGNKARLNETGETDPMTGTSWPPAMDSESSDPVDAPEAVPFEPGMNLPAVPPLADMPLHGFLTIEESSGKRVLDAWFVSEAGDTSEHSQTIPLISVPANDVCTSMAVTNEKSSLLLERTRAANAIELVSRGGLQARLNYFVSPTAVVYATDQRWLREPIDDDTQVHLVGNPRFESLTAPMLSAVIPLELNAPRRPVLGSNSTSLDWESSNHPDDRIVLTVWPRSRSTVSATSPTLHCTLVDDGHFTLASAMTDSAALEHSQYAFRMRRERRTEYHVEGMAWSIVQSSLAVF